MTKPITQEQFDYWVNYIELRWSKKYTDNEAISLFADYSNYTDETVGTAVIEQYSANNNFFSWSKLKNRCIEKTNDLARDNNNNEFIAGALKKPENQSGLREYLKSQGWGSISEAIFYKSVEGYRNKKLSLPAMENFEAYKDMSYEEATNKGWRIGIGDNIE